MRVRDTNDVVNIVLAGLGIGVLYQVVTGVRSTVVAGAIEGVVIRFQKEDQDFSDCRSSI